MAYVPGCRKRRDVRWESEDATNDGLLWRLASHPGSDRQARLGLPEADKSKPRKYEVDYSWHQPDKTLGKDPQDRGGFFIGSLTGIRVDPPMSPECGAVVVELQREDIREERRCG